MSSRVLFISYPFPPVGGAGVQRTAKFVKYLPAHGWKPSVLTVSNPSVPVLDSSLLRDIPADTLVCRARTLEPSYAAKRQTPAAHASNGGGFGRGLRRVLSRGVQCAAALALQPDAQVLWLPDALRKGRRLLRDVKHDVIVASAPPFSSFLLGLSLSSYARIPLVLDYRDEWDLSNKYLENRSVKKLASAVQRRMQDRVVRHAASLIATTRFSAQALQRVCARAGGRAHVSWIYNGYDPADFTARDIAAPSSHGFRITYVGTLWNLTDVSPLVRAMQCLTERAPEIASRIELVFAGRRTPPQQQFVSALRCLPCSVVEHEYVDHDKAVGLMRGADCLCLLLSDVDGAERVVPAKVFEYMASRKPILAIVPPGELAADILGGHPDAVVCSPRDPASIVRYLIDAVGSDRTKPPAGSIEPSTFSRPHQARELADLLSAVVAGKPLNN